MRVLLTGAAGFIGSTVARMLDDERARRGRRRRAAARGAPAPGGRARAAPARRPRRGPVGAPARRRRRRVPPGGDGGRGGDGRRPAGVRRPQRPRHRRAAGRDGGARRPTGSCWRRRWWCTARGATPARSTATAPRPRSAPSRRWRPGGSTPLPGLSPRPALGAGRRGRAARPAQQLRRQQGRPGALRGGVGAAGGRGRGRAALPQRLRAGHAARHAVLRASRRSSARPWSAGSRRGCSRTAGRCATSCTSTTSPAPTCWRSSGVATRATGALRAPTTSAPGRRSRSPTWRVWSAAATGDLDAERDGGVPRSATCATSWPRRREPPPSWGSPPRVTLQQGLAELRDRAAAATVTAVTSPCRAGAGRAGRRPPGATSPRRRQRSGEQGAGEQQPGHERQPDPLDLGLAHLARRRQRATIATGAEHQPAARRGSRRHAGVARPRSAPTPAPSSGPALKRERGEVAPHPVRRRAVAARRRPSSARAAPGSASHHENPNAANASTTAERGGRGRRQRPPGPRQRPARRAPGAPSSGRP